MQPPVQNGHHQLELRPRDPMASPDGPGGAPVGLGMGLMGLLQAKRGVPFRSINESGGGTNVGMETTTPASSLTSLLRRPAAAPERWSGSGGPDSTARPGTRQRGHERQEGLEGTEGSRPLKRPKSFAELRNKGSTSNNNAAFGRLKRETLTVTYPEEEETGHLLAGGDEGVGPSPFKDLEFEAGGLPVAFEDGKATESAFSSMVKMANNTAAKAKEKLAAVVEFWSPKRAKHADPHIPEGLWNDDEENHLERCPVGVSDKGRGKDRKTKKQKAANILAIARRASMSKSTTMALEKDFASVTSVKSKKAIRNTVNSVFKEARGSSGLPPTLDKIKLLGGILKAAGYRAAGNYLGEYKLMAIEGGYNWSDQLERTLKLAKRSSARAVGPKKKAAEVETCETGENFAVKVSAKVPKRVPLAAELFEFGVIWMLREVELAAIRKDHIFLDFQNKKVTFTLPVSKGDQEALQVKRVLQCLCERNICYMSCPFYTSVRLLDRMRALGLSRACMNKKAKLASKAQLVDDWRLLYGTMVSGHSARRTGALRYIRQGWAIAQVAYLGRWKSSVIYEYAAEALESLPVNVGDTFGAKRELPDTGPQANSFVGVSREEVEGIKNYLLAELEAAKVDQGQALQNLDKEVEELRARDIRLGNKLPPAVQSLPSKVVHYNMDIASCSPPRAWRTVCGWHYHRSDFVFVTKVDGLHLCKKCWDLARGNGVRDGEGPSKASHERKVSN